MEKQTGICRLKVIIGAVLQQVFSACRIFIMSTFFNHKEARLKKKHHFETTGSNPTVETNEDKIKQEIAKFDELLMSIKETEKTTVDDLSDIEAALQNLLSLDWAETEVTEAASPTYILDVEAKFKWLYSVQRKTYVPVRSGSEVIPVSTNSEGYFCVINNELFSLEEEWVSCVGWN